MSFTTTDQIADFEKDFASAMILRLLVDKPLMSMFRIGAAQAGGEGDMRIRWKERVRTPTQTTLTLDYVVAALSFKVADSSSFATGDQVQIKNHEDASFDPVTYRITDVPDATTLTVVVATNSVGVDASHTIAQGDRVARIRAFADNTTVGTGEIEEPTIADSFLQLFQRTFQLGDKAAGVHQGGNVPAVPDAFREGLTQIAEDHAWDIWDALIRGTGQAESGSAPAFTRGLKEFIDTSATLNEVNGGGLALTETMINDLIESIRKNGGTEGPKILFGNIANIRIISTLRHDKVQFVTESRDDPFGGRVTTYIPDVPDAGDLRLVSHSRFDDKRVLIMDPELIEIIPALRTNPETGGMVFSQFQTNRIDGQYGIRATLRTELALMIRNATRAHGRIINLLN